jgi:hypothetical protein
MLVALFFKKSIDLFFYYYKDNTRLINIIFARGEAKTLEIIITTAK